MSGRGHIMQALACIALLVLCMKQCQCSVVFDPGNVSSHLSAKTDDGRTGHSNYVRSNLSSKAEGTLLYIPGRVSYEQVEQMQKFAIGILGKIGGTTVDNVSKPLFAYVNMTAQDIDDNLRTDDGQKVRQNSLLICPKF
ncbi:unnamed protein product [Haemonchus placei]|uniref:Secreted metalloprotease n=1 Tax=Haemonchus placei TaxID=6290 RepID=A0A0N4WD52_HAEPC|nr:unnamed protein product [Haemonchus placei]